MSDILATYLSHRATFFVKDGNHVYERDFKNAIIAFCESHIPSQTNAVDRKEFYTRLKATIKAQHGCQDSWVS